MSHEAVSVAGKPKEVGREELFREFGKGLHDVCQPLTTLQCRLYLGAMEVDPKALREAIAQCLLECEQVILRVNELQRCLSELRPGTGDEG